ASLVGGLSVRAREAVVLCCLDTVLRAVGSDEPDQVSCDRTVRVGTIGIGLHGHPRDSELPHRVKLILFQARSEQRIVRLGVFSQCEEDLSGVTAGDLSKLARGIQ